jgi:predicted GNAT family N-acyltransferase
MSHPTARLRWTPHLKVANPALVRVLRSPPILARAIQRYGQPMGAEQIPIRWATGDDELQGALKVREQVFCGEQGVPRSEEVDGLDDLAMHLVALEPDGRGVIGTLRLLRADGIAKIGRVAVEREWRRRGIASRMLDAAIALARERGCGEARLAAQLNATRLYETAGFVVESEPFEQAGIVHVWMGRALTP